MDLITLDEVQRIDQDNNEIAIVKLYFQPWEAVPTGNGHSDSTRMFCMSLDDFRNGLQSQQNMCVAGIRPEVRDNVISAVDGGYNVNANGTIFYPNRALGCYKKLNMGDAGYRYVLYDVDLVSRPILYGLNSQLFEEAGDQELKIKRVLSHTNRKQGIYATLRPIQTDVRAYNEREEAGVGDTHGQPDIHTFWGVVDVQIDKKRDIENDPYVFKSTEELRKAVDLYSDRISADEAKEIYGDMSTWDVSNVQDMDGLFTNLTSFNEDISRWDVGNVKDMSSMFMNCYAFNGNLSGWNVQRVKDMKSMFMNCRNFNSDLSRWNVESVENMHSMFKGCENFNRDLSQWLVNENQVKKMNSMFNGCKTFNTNLSQWNVNQVENMNSMFYGCKKFNSDLSQWKVNQVKHMAFMFHGCVAFTSNLSRWDVGMVEDMHYMFFYCKVFESNLSQWNVHKVKSMHRMFMACEKFKSDLSKWDVKRVESMEYMFFACKEFNSDLSQWDVTNVNYMGDMMFFGSMMENMGNIPEWYHKHVGGSPL